MPQKIVSSCQLILEPVTANFSIERSSAYRIAAKQSSILANPKSARFRSLTKCNFFEQADVATAVALEIIVKFSELSLIELTWFLVQEALSWRDPFLAY